MIGRSMGYRQHKDAGVAVFVGADRGDDCARAILLAFIPPFKMFAIPEIAVTNNETGDRFRKCHSRSLQLGIEMRELIRHLGMAHGLDPFLGKFGCQANAPVTPL